MKDSILVRNHKRIPAALVYSSGKDGVRVVFTKPCGCTWTLDDRGRVYFAKVCDIAAPQPQYDPDQLTLLAVPE